MASNLEIITKSEMSTISFPLCKITKSVINKRKRFIRDHLFCFILTERLLLIKLLWDFYLQSESLSWYMILTVKQKIGVQAFSSQLDSEIRAFTAHVFVSTWIAYF